MASGDFYRPGALLEELSMLLSPTVLLSKVTVLVVEDEDAVRRYISRVMEDAGYHVLAAQDGLHGLSLLRASRFPVQLVITDVCMPRMTGPELAARIATGPYPPPVLFISGGHADSELPGPVLRKPFLPHGLTGMAGWMLSRRPALRLSATLCPARLPHRPPRWAVPPGCTAPTPSHCRF
jgi:CheY-like chemotaxis protein